MISARKGGIRGGGLLPAGGALCWVMALVCKLVPQLSIAGGHRMERSHMECRKTQNMKVCTCSYEPCPRKGLCCECISYHLRGRQLPACCFPDDAERTYDRSFGNFARLVTANRV